MRTFKHFNSETETPCPICGTTDDKETLLIGIVGTEKENNIEARQVHTECLQEGLVYDKKFDLIYAIAEK